MKNCDYCGRENPEDAVQCRECGTPFPVAQSSQPAEPEPPQRPKHTPAEKQMLIGAIWFFGGILVTGLTYTAAKGHGGGTYVVAWGAILFGGVRFFRGLTARESKTTSQYLEVEAASNESEPTGYETLAEGTRLEGAGHIEEAIAVYRKVIENFPGTDASHDAQKSIDSLNERLR